MVAVNAAEAAGHPKELLVEALEVAVVKLSIAMKTKASHSHPDTTSINAAEEEVVLLTRKATKAILASHGKTDHPITNHGKTDHRITITEIGPRGDEEATSATPKAVATTSITTTITITTNAIIIITSAVVDNLMEKKSLKDTTKKPTTMVKNPTALRSAAGIVAPSAVT